MGIIIFYSLILGVAFVGSYLGTTKAIGDVKKEPRNGN